jgi:hypothetical protein
MLIPITTTGIRTFGVEQRSTAMALSSRTQTQAEALGQKPTTIVSTPSTTCTTSTYTSRKNVARLRLLHQSVEKLLQLALEQLRDTQGSGLFLRRVVAALESLVKAKPSQANKSSKQEDNSKQSSPCHCLCYAPSKSNFRCWNELPRRLPSRDSFMSPST